jgi:hypothetical protein
MIEHQGETEGNEQYGGYRRKLFCAVQKYPIFSLLSAKA